MNRRKSVERASRWGASRVERREVGLSRHTTDRLNPAIERTCEACHRVFLTRRAYARTCSPRCRKALQRAKPTVRRCEAPKPHSTERCNGIINPRSRSDRRYCGHACNVRALRATSPEDLSEARQARAHKARTIPKRRTGGRLTGVIRL